MLEKLHGPFMAHMVKEATNVRIQHPVHSLPMESHTERIQRLMRATPRPEAIREALEVRLINLFENGYYGLLHNFVFQRRNSQRALAPVSLRYVDPPRGFRPIRSRMNAVV